jgi:magnesium chelatase subunit H
VPYIAAHALEFQTLSSGRLDRGLMPVEATMMVAIPELDGATGRWSSAGAPAEARGTGSRDMQPHPERAEIPGRPRSSG